jgi:8-amino-7-oxononanoate synthase
MDGDSPDLQGINAGCKQHNAWWMLDDAHGVGIHGENGSGTLSAQGLEITQCDILVTTFGKAIGAQGAAVIAPKLVSDYLVNFSRDYVYSTHLSPLQTTAVMNNISKIQTETWRRERLHENIRLFREGVQETSLELVPSNSPIQPIVLGDETRATKAAEYMKKQGIWIGAMRYPTVAKSQARLRVTITASHTPQDIQRVISALKQLDKEIC